MRILLAEDEQSLARALTTILQKNNMEADAVDNGNDALYYLESGNYDAAVLDVMMPGMDGITVLKKAREKGLTLPILMLTARAEISDRVSGLDAGANDYLTKPFAVQELLARIRAMTRPAASAHSAELAAGNVTLNRTDYHLTGPAGSFRLTGKEFQLMEILMLNPHRLMSADTIFSRIWGMDSDVEMSVVWVYVSYLRKKLTALEANVQIRAVRGAGYSLEVAE